jgi:hypothetical protein
MTSRSTVNAASKQRGKPFQKGQSGNPSGKPVGARHRTTVAAETLLDGEAEKLTRKAVDMALGGDVTAMRMCLDRILPPRRDRTIAFSLPPIRTASDLMAGAAALVTAVANGELSPAEAADLSRLLANVATSLEASEFEERLKKLEDAKNGQ